MSLGFSAHSVLEMGYEQSKQILKQKVMDTEWQAGLEVTDFPVFEKISSFPGYFSPNWRSAVTERHFPLPDVKYSSLWVFWGVI